MFLVFHDLVGVASAFRALEELFRGRGASGTLGWAWPPGGFAAEVENKGRAARCGLRPPLAGCVISAGY